MDETEETLQDSLAGLDEIAKTVKPPDAWRRFGEVTLERFWQSWPEVRGWGEWLFTLIEKERGDKAEQAPTDEEHDETGGGG